MLIVTPGEPAGIGLDLVVMFAQARRDTQVVVYADADALSQRAKTLNLELTVNSRVDKPSCLPGELTVQHVPLARTPIPGILDLDNVPGVLAALDLAIEGCRTGQYQGLVTGPMQKSVVNDAGYAFSGHTEYLAQACKVEDVVMLLVAGDLRVALATTHIPISQVSKALTSTLLARRLQILHRELEHFFVNQPKILVAGLNPHAGESGHIGTEEIDVIIPVCDALREQGLDLVGPLPADTLFTPMHLQSADAVMAMFHDQGLPVLKYAGFGRAVNVTLGLPFVRTSVDHGTALDKAGSGQIDPGSFAEAVSLAAKMATH